MSLRKKLAERENQPMSRVEKMKDAREQAKAKISKEETVISVQPLKIEQTSIVSTHKLPNPKYKLVLRLDHTFKDLIQKRLDQINNDPSNSFGLTLSINEYIAKLVKDDLNKA